MKTSVNAVSVKCKYQQFPWKLHEMLNAAEDEGFADIVSWSPDGDSFHVHDKDRFAQRLMSEYFKSLRYKTFQRNLNLWGFRTRTKEPRKGDIYHGKFLKGKKELCDQMVRVRVKQKNARRYLKMNHALNADNEARDGHIGQVASFRQVHAAASQPFTVSPLGSETDECGNGNGTRYGSGFPASASHPLSTTNAAAPAPAGSFPVVLNQRPSSNPNLPMPSYLPSPAPALSRSKSPSVSAPVSNASTESSDALGNIHNSNMHNLEMLNQLNASLFMKYLEIMPTIQKLQMQQQQQQEATSPTTTAATQNVEPVSAALSVNDTQHLPSQPASPLTSNVVEAADQPCATTLCTTSPTSQPIPPSNIDSPRSDVTSGRSCSSHGDAADTRSNVDGTVSSGTMSPHPLSGGRNTMPTTLPEAQARLQQLLDSATQLNGILSHLSKQQSLAIASTNVAC